MEASEAKETLSDTSTGVELPLTVRDGTVATSKEVRWQGGSATSTLIVDMEYEADVVPSAYELIFAFQSRVCLGEAHSYGKVKGSDAPRCAFIFPPGLDVGWRVKRITDQELLVVKLENGFLLRSAEMEHLPDPRISDVWYHEDPLQWQLGKAIYEECRSEVRQGLLFIETAATLLALQTIRRFSSSSMATRNVRRGGLSPTALRRVCDYMMSRLEQEMSLQELAGVAHLSPGHFAFAFKRTVGLSVFAWVRRQRIERAKPWLSDQSVDLATISRLAGYANLSAFGVAFKRETGLTPSQWRRAH